MFYPLYELSRAFVRPAAALAAIGARMFSEPNTWLAALPGGPRLAASFELLHRIGKDYPKPEFGIQAVAVGGAEARVVQRVILSKPFCQLLHFQRSSEDAELRSVLQRSPTVLVVAPLSGHYATLLRDTVRTLLADHDVYITDWTNARLVPRDRGPFTLDDYVAYVRDFIELLGAERLHVVSVCQPCVPVLGAVSLMASAGERIPLSITMMGGPIDARRNPTSVNDLPRTRPLAWFERYLVQEVPLGYPGWGRRVYPGFLQHAGFIAMNPGHHSSAHWDFYRHLVEGDLQDAETHRRFYDEYNAVMDVPGEYYLDCIRIVFQQHLLPRGLWDVAGRRVDPTALRNTALLTIEGQRDDISGIGQTSAAHDLCTNIAQDRRHHLLAEGTGHYGIFSGRRWRERIYPVVRDFIRNASVAAARGAA